MAGTVKGYKKAARRFHIEALYGVCLGDTGSQIDTVRKVNRLPEALPVYTLQGGMDHQKLRGVYKSMIQVLIKVLSAKKDRTPDEEKMLDLLIKGGNYVSEEHLDSIDSL